MSTARKHLGCAVYQDYIYAVGGRDDSTELNSVERYSDKGIKYFGLTVRSFFGISTVNFISQSNFQMTVGSLLLQCKQNDLELGWQL